MTAAGRPVRILSDGSTVEYDEDGSISRKTAPDGAVYTKFDHTGRAHHVTMPATNGQPTTSADITYDAGGNVVGEKAADGTDYTRFDRGGRPHYVDIPATADQPPSPAALTYQGDAGETVDATGSRPPPVRAAPPATSAQVAYDNAYTSYRNADKTGLTFPSSNNALASRTPPAGTVSAGSGPMLTQPAPEGVTGTSPEAGPLPVGMPATADQPAATADAPSAGGNQQPVSIPPTAPAPESTAATTSGTTSYTEPQQVSIPPTAAAPESTATSYTGSDGTGATSANTPLSETMPDGTVYSNFDSGGNPQHVTIPATATAPESTADISYGNGTTSYTYSDGTVATYDSASNSILSETMPDGTVYTNFDSGGNPQSVAIPAQGGMPATTAAISYAAGQTVYSYPDGTTVSFDSASGQVVKQTMPDGWAINYQDGKPVSGANAATGATVAIAADGNNSVWTYSDGTKVWEDSSGTPWKEEANGWTFTEFDGNGQPTSGTRTLADGSTETVTINYDFGTPGDTQWIYVDDGQTTTVVTDPNGVPVSQTNPDGTSFQFAVEIPKLLDAIKSVSGQRDVINDAIASIGKQWDSIHQDLWSGPGGDSFYGHVSDFQNLQQSVAGVLSGAIQRMQISYNNYVDVERANDANLTPIQVEDSPPAPGSTATVPDANLT